MMVREGKIRGSIKMDLRWIQQKYMNCEASKVLPGFLHEGFTKDYMEKTNSLIRTGQGKLSAGSLAGYVSQAYCRPVIYYFAIESLSRCVYPNRITMKSDPRH